MRAAMFYGPGDLRVEDVPEPQVGPGEVGVRVAYNGICGTDLHEYFFGYRMVPTSPHPLTGAVAPVILGHEAAGYVTEIGDGVEGLTVGDLVAIEPIIACGTCPRCQSGAYNLCPTSAFHGLASSGGGMSEKTVVSSLMVHRMPPGTDALTAAIVEPMAVAFHSVQRADAREGETVVVHGAGPIGIGIFLALRSIGCRPIIIEPTPFRREAISRLGAETVLDPASDDIRAAVMDLTGGSGASVSIDAAGGQAVFSSTFDLIAPQGRIVLVGAATEALQFDLAQMFSTEATVSASMAYRNDFPTVIEAMASGHYSTDGWVETIALEDVVRDGFERLHRGEAIKVLVEIGGSA